MDRDFVALACLSYLVAAFLGCYGLGSRRFGPDRTGFAFLALGFLLQTAGMMMRARAIGHCPVSNLYETILFVSWSIGLNYLLIGPIFRLSLLGSLTAPLVLTLNLVAILFPGFDQPREMPGMSAMLEMHIGLSLVAYGTLGLGAMAALFFLFGDHLLKARSGPNLLSKLPPIGQLERVSFRVALFGWLLLTVGLGFGFLVPDSHGIDNLKMGWSMSVWGIYLFLLMGRYLSKLSPVRFAWSSSGVFCFMLVTFWAVNQLSRPHQFLNP
jgi:ABC-type uncharacterized transport system permease subunit